MGHSPSPIPSLLSTEARLGYQSKDLEEAKALGRGFRSDSYDTQ